MANEFIVRKGYIALENSQVTGSLSVTGNISASIFSGSFVGNGSQLTGVSAGFPFTGSAQITGSLGVTGSVTATSFFGNGSQLTGIDGFPFTGSAAISGSLIVVGPVNATSFTGSIQGTATTASYVQLANVDGFTAYSASINTTITPQTATVNTGSSPLTLTTQSIVIADSTNGNLIVNLPDLNTVVGTPNQKPIVVYKNDYSQNVIYVNPSGSQLVNGASQDIIVSIQLAVIYNPTSAGWVTEGTSAQSLAELELFFLSLTETGSLATTGSNVFIGNQIVTGSLTVTGNITGNITGSASTASYVEYANVANKPAIVSGSSQISFNGITDKPTLVSGSAQVTYSGLTGIPSGILSGSAQIASFGIFATTGSNQFNGNQSITGSLTVSGQVVAQTLNVQQVTSSIVYSSGSNIFGNSVSNTQQFTGSLQVSGSSHYLLGSVGVGTTTPEGKLTIQGTAAELPNSGTAANSLIQLKSNLSTELNMGLNTVSGDYGAYIQASDNNLAVPYGLYLQPNGGNVGIGTIKTRGLLHLFGPEVAAYKTYTGQGNTLGGDTIINAYRLDASSAYLRVTDIVALGDDTNNRGSSIRLMTTNTSGVTSAALTLASTGAATFSSTVSGTSIRSSAVGSFGFNTANNGEFQIYATAVSGIVIAGRGSSTDMVITNKNGSDVITIPTGTTNILIGAIGGGTATASPVNLSLGSTFSNAGGSNLKLTLFNDTGGNVYGLGVSNNRMDFNVPSGAAYSFYTGNVLIGTTSNDTNAKLRVSGNVRIDGFQKMTTYYAIAQPNTTATITISSPTGTNMQGSMQVMAGGYGNSLSGNVTGLWMVGGLLFFDNASTSTITQIVNSVTANGSMSFQRSGDQYTVTLANTSSLYTKTFYVSVIINGD